MLRFYYTGSPKKKLTSFLKAIILKSAQSSSVKFISLGVERHEFIIGPISSVFNMCAVNWVSVCEHDSKQRDSSLGVNLKTQREKKKKKKDRRLTAKMIGSQNDVNSFRTPCAIHFVPYVLQWP